LQKNFRSLLREVATAFPNAQVEVWAMDEHRIGLKPLLRRGWAPVGQRAGAPVADCFPWGVLVGVGHPAPRRAVWHLDSRVSIPVFEMELTAFARAMGAGPQKEIVLVLDQAGWHASVHLRVPDHVHLLFLPPLYRKVLTDVPSWIRVAGGVRTTLGVL